MRNELNETWQQLYQDRELGAGNFLFKAHAAYARPDVEFLFLEKSFVSPGGKVYRAFSLSTLREAVLDLAAWYSRNEVQTGSYVCLYLAEGIPPFVHFLALNSLGCTPVLINGSLKPEIAAAYTTGNRFEVFVYDDETQTRCRASGALTDMRALNAGFAQREQPALATLPAAVWPAARRDGDHIMICHSSGTTGIPKAVIFTHDQFLNGKRERLLHFVERDDEKLATAMPTTHAAGISYLMTAVLLQIPTLSMSTHIGRSAAEMVAQHAPTIMTAFPQTYASFARLGLSDGYLKSIQRFYNTADSAHEAHIRELLRLAPAARFTDMFGASELGMSQFFKTSQAGAIASTRTVGKPAHYAECAILSANGEPLPDGQPGYVGVRSGTITPGYFGQPHLTELTRLNGFWLTGDVGIRKPNGEFVHLDRIADVVDSCLGAKVYTLLLEEHALKLPDVFDVTVVGVKRGPTNEQAVVALAQGRPGAPRLEAESILRHLMTAHPFASHAPALPRYTLCVGILQEGYELPVGSTGKVLKRIVRDGYWDLQREYDDGDRTKLGKILWNHQLNPAASQSPSALRAPAQLADAV